MPDNPAVLLMESTAAFAPVLLSVQAGLFLLLLLAVSFCDIRSREIPDSLQLSIAALTILCFTPENLLGILGALPYLVAALFFGGADGIGGGDIKLAAATGMVLGLPASILASLIGLFLFLLFGVAYRAVRKRKGRLALPLGPFLAAGTITAYFIR